MKTLLEYIAEAEQRLTEMKDAAGAKGMHPDALAAIPDSQIWPELDNSSGYLAYRFGVQLAGSPDMKGPIAGPTGLKMVTIAYSEADKAILDATAKHLNTKGVQLSPNASTENPTVDKVSPIAKPKKNKYGV